MTISKLKTMYQSYYQSYQQLKSLPNKLQGGELNFEKYALFRSSEEAYRRFKISVEERLNSFPTEGQQFKKILSNTQILRHRQKESERKFYEVDYSKPADIKAAVPNVIAVILLIQRYFNEATEKHIQATSLGVKSINLNKAKTNVNNEANHLLKTLREKSAACVNAVGTKNEAHFTLKLRRTGGIRLSRFFIVLRVNVDAAFPSNRLRKLFQDLFAHVPLKK